MYRADVLDQWNPIKPYTLLWRSSMETQIAATECADRAIEAVEKLNAVVDKFSKNYKNDLVSMKAVSQRIQDETSRMREKYLATQELLTSADFERAIANAERMATALKAISEVSSAHLSVSLLKE
jgi:type I site-specific restriction endonuclease